MLKPAAVCAAGDKAAKNAGFVFGTLKAASPFCEISDLIFFKQNKM
jgi:hypothetical protein